MQVNTRFLALLLIVGLISISGCASQSAFKTAPTSNSSSQHQETMMVLDGKNEDNKDIMLLAESLVNKEDKFQATKLPLAASIERKIKDALEDIEKQEYIAAQNKLDLLFRQEARLPSQIYVLAGDIALSSGQTQQALQYYQQALNNNKKNATAANRLGKHMREQGNFSRAYSLYTQAIQSQPSRPESYRNRAVLNDLYLNNKEQALEDYKAYQALLTYQLAMHEGKVLISSKKAVTLVKDEDNSIKAQEALTNVIEPKSKVVQKSLNKVELKQLKKDLVLVNRWIIDVDRQIKTLASQQAGN